MAIIGCGVRGSDAASAISAARGVELSAVVDASESAARTLAHRHGVSWSTDLTRALEDPRLDAVYVASPHHLHAEHGIEAAKAGKHLVVEKPLAHKLSAATELVSVAGMSGVTLVPWLGFRYLPEVVLADRLIEQGMLGRFLGGTLVHHLSKPPSYFFRQGQATWQARREFAGGGVLITQAIHYLDWLLYLGREEATEVSARYETLESGTEVEDSLVMWVRFSNGALATLNASTCVPGLYRSDQVQNEFRIWGSDGHLSLTRPFQFFSSRLVAGRHPERWHDLAPLPRMHAPAVELLERFAHHLRTGEPQEITPSDGLRVQALVEAAYGSGEAGRPMTPQRP
jgi:predicted dehydrogenase